ncbi:hypothetical protein DLM_4345 [Aquitalea magnusonii]|uniref:Uncharacterized protein n=1 Tax=Aquitalea magnusonii TaxID=332411 RepID=A0A3G9GJ47_9NEIS|nr:hypothetical protein DLM_4345 [Aquitalea magnusonii]
MGAGGHGPCCCNCLNTLAASLAQLLRCEKCRSRHFYILI